MRRRFPFPSKLKPSIICDASCFAISHKVLPKAKYVVNIKLKYKSIIKSATMTTPPKLPIVGDESIMSAKAHGTSTVPVQSDLRWGCDKETADRICNFNRHYAEHAGYFKQKTNFEKEARKELEEKAAGGGGGGDEKKEITFFDSNTGKPLFYAPRGRTWDEFIVESNAHGWPSFRDEEVNWDYVRCLKDGEAVSVDGTHLGHNLPDKKGNRYCINLVSVAGKPMN